jgi:hypothetical protein
MTPRSRRQLAAGLLLAAILPLAGCYEHVVSASGPGADRVNVVKPNVPREADRGVAGPRTIQQKPLRRPE